MKKFLILLIIAVKINSIQAQEYDTVPPYQKDSMHIPAFTVIRTDSTFITDKAIPKDKPVVIIYFSPTCGHCQITAQEFGEKMKDMKDIYFVWVTYSHPLSEIEEFAKKFNLQQFNNTMIGRLSNYNLPSFLPYKIYAFHGRI